MPEIPDPAAEAQIVAVMCPSCDAQFEAKHIPDFCGECRARTGRWLVIWQVYEGLLGTRLEVEPVGEWPPWALAEVAEELGDHFRPPRTT